MVLFVIADQIQDIAVSLAKRWSHPQVDRRHIFAVVMASPAVAECSALSPNELERLLAPPGTATGQPAITADAMELLSRCTDDEALSDLAIELFEEFQSGGLGAQSRGTAAV